jgi:ATP-dependent Zn protease
MVIFWLLALAWSISSAAIALLVFQVGAVTALAYALISLLVAGGLFVYIRRALVLRESIPDYDDMDKRTLEVNRYIFWRRTFLIGVVATLYFGALGLVGVGPGEALLLLPGLIASAAPILLYVMFIFLFQFLIFFGPFLLFGKMGRQTVVPGDANYDVKIEDIRGQKSAVEEMKRILKLMEKGRNYVKAGGKREKGVLFVGPPGTGKTMLAKGIASSLHMPIIITSGSAFSGMFLGMDMVSVFMMVRAAKKKAKRWGGCSIFIDEFDALGTRRGGMGGGAGGAMGGMFGGGQLGLNTLLVLMDGVDNPGFLKRGIRRFVNVSLDGLFIPREIRMNGSRLSLRIPQLRAPRFNLFFMGATNRPSVLDEAVTRPGRFGRTITFRMPAREDRRDIAELYFDKKAHDPELDRPERRDEFARVTDGYSPAMIEQALSVALMYAFEDGRAAFVWTDLRDAMGNIEAGLAEGVTYSERDKVAIARHELGHAIAAHFFRPDHDHARLSVKMRQDALGHHRAIEQVEQFVLFRSQLAGDLRHALGSLAAERVFYGENSTGVSADLRSATRSASLMIGLVGMGPELQLTPEGSKKAIRYGEYLISTAEMAGSVVDGTPVAGSLIGPVLGNPMTRKAVAQALGAAYVDCWRLMWVNRDAIDRAAEELMKHGELVGDEIRTLLDSVGLRTPDPDDPYPDELPEMPATDAEEMEKARRAATGLSA